MSDETTIVICVPTAHMPNPVEGSLVALCRDCRQPVWRSPSSFQLQRVTLLCVSCAHREVKRARQRGKPLQFGGVLPGQLDEVLRSLARRGDSNN